MADLARSASAVRLAAGRRLAWSEIGSADGFPVLYLHGAIGSPLDAGAELGAAVATHGLRLLLLRRPGFGGSDPQPGRTLLHFAADVEQFADALGLEAFAVLGVSAGGPYAVACAHRLSDRITAAAAVSSLSPLCSPAHTPGLPAHIRWGLRALAAAPRPAAWLGDAAVSLFARHPALLARTMALGAPAADRDHLADGASSAAAAEAFLAATAGGVAGLIEDHLLTSRPWGFDLADVAGEVHVWHGVRDPFVPVEHALQLAAALPRCRVALDRGEGHFFFRRRAAEILGALADAGARAPAPAGRPVLR